MTTREDMIERFTKYLMKVECKYCGDEVYPHEEDARDQAEYWFDYDDAKDIEALKARLDRVCNYCNDKLDSDD
jgi:DNA-directed RNA polymerase subunit RPC12/RpoP